MTIVAKFQTSEAIKKELESIKVAGKKLDTRIQDAAVSVLVHFAQHKDTGLVNRLYLSLSAGARKSAMTSWILAYCAVVPNQNKDTMKEQPFVYSREKDTLPEAGALDPWYNHKADPKPNEVFDLQKSMMALIKKAMAANTIKGGDREMLVTLGAIVGIHETDIPTKAFNAEEVAEEETEEVAE